MRQVTSLPLALLFVACGSPPAPEAPKPTSDGVDSLAQIEPQEFVPPPRDTAPDSIVRAQFVPSVSGIRPGGVFQVAMHFDIHPGYRLGWLFAGDVGKPTAVRFSAPPGFEVGSVSFTGPSRFTLSGGLTSYGYKERATAFAEVRAPLELSAGDVYRFNVKASWLACERECVAEATEAYFELETDPDAAEAVFSPELQTQLAAVPVPLANLTNARFEWRTAATLAISAEGANWLEFYPGSERLKAVVASSGNALALEFQSRANREEWVGVAKALVDGREVFVDLQALK